MRYRPKPTPLERIGLGMARQVVQSTLGAILSSWGPQDLLVAISVDVDLLQATKDAVPQVLEAGRNIARMFPKVEETLAGDVLYAWLEKNYPHLFVWDNGGSKIEILASPRGRDWLNRQVQRFRAYFWGS